MKGLEDDLTNFQRTYSKAEWDPSVMDSVTQTYFGRTERVEEAVIGNHLEVRSLFPEFPEFVCTHKFDSKSMIKTKLWLKVWS